MVGMSRPLLLNNVLLRDYNHISDSDFVYSTWIKSFRDSGYCRAVPTPIYNRSQRGRIEALLDKKHTYVLIACSPETPELIYGYCVGEAPNVLHYIYVKMGYRNQGIGKRLLLHLLDHAHSNPVLYTHKPPDIALESALKERGELQNFLYDPYWMERERK
jgi:ribosomal protein S18 acetylase RimI-like enzyme